MSAVDRPIDLERAVVFLALHLQRINMTFSDADRGRVVNSIRKRMQNPKVGDLVIEWMMASLIVAKGGNPAHCIGRLLEIIPGETEYTKKWVLRLGDGTTTTWMNSQMLVIPEELILDERET